MLYGPVGVGKTHMVIVADVKASNLGYKTKFYTVTELVLKLAEARKNGTLILFICKYIPLKQWAFDDSHSPKYQKFKIDELPRIISFQQDWNWLDLISYYQ